MSLKKALENLKYDKRLIELNIKLGRLSKSEIDQHNSALADVEAQSEKLNIEKEEKGLN